MAKKKVILSTAQIAAIFRVAPQTLTTWKNTGGCPQVSRGKYDAAAVLEWWIDNMLVSERSGSGTKDKVDSHNRYWAAKAEGEELKVKKVKGELVDRHDIAIEWGRRVNEITNGLQTFSMRLPPVLEGLDQIEMREKIEEEVWKLRDTYSRTGRYCPKEKKDGK